MIARALLQQVMRSGVPSQSPAAIHAVPSVLALPISVSRAPGKLARYAMASRSFWSIITEVVLVAEQEKSVPG